MRTTRRTMAALASAAVVAALVPLAGSPATAAPAQSGIAWHDCDNPFYVELGLQCATLDVAMDPARPSGPVVHLAVTRRAHTAAAADYQGVVLINPGGPGGSGAAMPFISYLLPDDVAAAYDWIGWDPRGVGDTTPTLSCDPSYFDPVRPPYEPFGHGIERAWLTRSSTYAAACDAAGGDLLEHMSTLDNVRDMDSIRVALGQEKINYYGYSYGTYLGQLYATLHPDRVRRMILDSNVRSSTVWEKFNLEQNVGFEKVMQVWYRWIAKYDAVYHLGTSGRAVERTVLRARAQLARAPKPGFGAAEFTDALLNAGYSQYPGPVSPTGSPRSCTTAMRRRCSSTTAAATTTSTPSTSPPSAPTPAGRAAGTCGVPRTTRRTRRRRSTPGATPGSTHRARSGPSPAGLARSSTGARRSRRSC